MAMTTKRIVSSLLCLGAVVAACDQAAEPPREDAAASEPPRGDPSGGEPGGRAERARRVGSDVEVSITSAGGEGRDLEFEGASFLRLHFSSLALAPDDRLIIEGAGGETLSYTAQSNGSDVWIAPVDGNKLSVRLERGRGAAGSYAIDRVGVGFPDPPEALGPVASMCGVNDLVHVACFNTSTHPLYNPAAFNAARSVVQFLFAASGGQALCSGFLLSGTNLALTNYHCVPNQGIADTITTIYNFQVAACGGTALAPKETTSGAVFLRGSPLLDYALLRLPANQVPPQTPGGPALNPAAKYGFIPIDPTAVLKTNETVIYIPQHAGGSAARKQIAVVDSDAGGQRCVVRGTDLTIPGGKAGAAVGYRCDTQNGSSGSPVISAATNKAVALHNAGDCPAAFNYGVNLRDIYPEIKCHLEGTTCPGGTIGSVAEDSCLGRCNVQAPAGCFCDTLCASHNDCCPDKAPVCGTSSAATSCEGRCNGSQQAPSGCWCDPACGANNDCCADRTLFCGP
jgi:trypsin-like peptidase/somatomedin B domain-containing protein